MPPNFPAQARELLHNEGLQPERDSDGDLADPCFLHTSGSGVGGRGAQVGATQWPPAQEAFWPAFCVFVYVQTFSEQK